MLLFPFSSLCRMNLRNLSQAHPCFNCLTCSQNLQTLTMMNCDDRRIILIMMLITLMMMPLLLMMMMMMEAIITTSVII